MRVVAPTEIVPDTFSYSARLSIDAIEVLGTALRMPLSEMFKGL